MNTCYTWEYQLEVPPYEKIIEVVEAFFASYPGGDYDCQQRQRYRLTFRRGCWRRSMLGLGDWVPDRLVKGQFNQWPIIVGVLIRPSPQSFLLTIRYELYPPKKTPDLGPNLQASVDLHIRQELEDLADYLAECIELDASPAVKSV